MNAAGRSAASATSELCRKEAERARETAKQALSARDRAFRLALSANWEKFAKEAEAGDGTAISAACEL